jgi:hypothetical protein
MQQPNRYPAGTGCAEATACGLHSIASRGATYHRVYGAGAATLFVVGAAMSLGELPGIVQLYSTCKLQRGTCRDA